MVRRIAVGIVVGAATLISDAQTFSPLSQSRHVDASAWAQGVNVDNPPGYASPRVDVAHSESAPDLGFFSSTLHAAAPWASTQLGTPRSGTVHADAMQTSEIGVNQIKAVGYTFADYQSSLSLVGWGGGTATSYFETSFLVAVPTMARLAADIAAIDPSNGLFFSWGTATFLFDGPSAHFDVTRSPTTIVGDGVTFGPTTYHTDETLFLSPGTYTLRATASATPSGLRNPLHAASFSVQLDVVPEPGTAFGICLCFAVIARRMRVVQPV